MSCQIIVEDPHRAARNMRSSSYSRYEPSSYRRNRTDFWQTVWDKFQYCLLVLASMILGVGLANGLDWVDDKYSICAKVKTYFSSASKDASKNESVKRCEREFERDVPVSQNSRYFVTCPFCSTQFDVTELGTRYFVFDCHCPNPNCMRVFRVENRY